MPFTSNFTKHLARDPKEEFFSSYVYCANNPLIYVDPDGKEHKIYLTYSTNIKMDKTSFEARLSQEFPNKTIVKVSEMGVGADLRIYLTMDKTDMQLDLTDETREWKSGYGVSVTNSKKGKVYVNRIKDHNTLKSLSDKDFTEQIVKTAKHETGHGLYGFPDNIGGVMNQGYYIKTGLNWTKSQEIRINEIDNNDVNMMGDIQ